MTMTRVFYFYLKLLHVYTVYDDAKIFEIDYYCYKYIKKYANSHFPNKIYNDSM